MAGKWLRLNVDFDDSEWVSEMSDLAQFAWIKFLCLVKKEGIRGKIKDRSTAVWARKLRLPESAVGEMMECALNHESPINPTALDYDQTAEEDILVVRNWSKYQENDYTVNERMARYRKPKTETGSGYAVTTVTNRNIPLHTVTAVARDNDNDNDNDSNKKGEDISAPTRKRFQKPDLEDVRSYMETIGLNGTNPEKFMDFHDSKGWVIGKAPMKDWKAACRTWKHNQSQSAPKRGKDSIEDVYGRLAGR